MVLTEKQIIEKAKFLITDQEAGARIPSFLAGWHDENAVALTAMLDAYIRLNMLEQLSMRVAGKYLTDLLATFGETEVDTKKAVSGEVSGKSKSETGEVG